MARARTIKPGFFANEDLAKCNPLARILFAGLWTIADREGRLEDRPTRIKVLVLPYDNCDCDALLTQLNNGGFIHRYDVDGQKCIQVVKFKKHATPHPKEGCLELPPPPVPKADICKNESGNFTASFEELGSPRKRETEEGKQEEGKSGIAPETTVAALAQEWCFYSALDSFHKDRNEASVTKRFMAWLKEGAPPMVLTTKVREAKGQDIYLWQLKERVFPKQKTQEKESMGERLKRRIEAQNQCKVSGNGQPSTPPSSVSPPKPTN